MQYEIIESRRWRASDGRSASIYGANPFRTDAERERDGWRVEVSGWTVRNPHTGEIGIGRKPWETRAEAQAFVEAHQPSRIRIGD